MPSLPRCISGIRSKDFVGVSSRRNHSYSFDGFTLTSDGMFSRDGVSLPLAAKERKLLGALLAWGGQVVSKDALALAAWGHTEISDESLTRAIYVIRRTLNETAAQKYIGTCYGRGYRFLRGFTCTSALGRGSINLAIIPSDMIGCTAVHQMITDCLPVKLGENLSWISSKIIKKMLNEREWLEKLDSLGIDFYIVAE